MRKTDGAPGEESGQPRQRLEPVENNDTSTSKGDVGKRGPSENKDSRPQRTASLVDISEDFGSIALLSQCSQCARSTVDTRETD